MQEEKICGKMQAMKRRRVKKTINFKWIFLGAAALILTLILLIAVGLFRVTELDITGNSYYTEEEITDLLMEDSYNNSLYLMFQYDYLGGKEIPFVDSVEISFVSPSHLKVRVYEKAMIGYAQICILIKMAPW